MIEMGSIFSVGIEYLTEYDFSALVVLTLIGS